MKKYPGLLQQFSFGYLIYSLSRACITDLSRRFTKDGVEITVEQYRTLYVINKYPGNTQQWISDTLLIDKSSLSRLVSALKCKNLVRKDYTQGMGNHFRIYLTPEGEAMVVRCYTMAMEMTRELMDGFSKEEQFLFRKSLLKARGKIKRMLHEESTPSGIPRDR